MAEFGKRSRKDGNNGADGRDEPRVDRPVDLDEELREAFSHVLHEPLPPRLAELLDKLASKKLPER